jgi:quinoprotein relay system zinc metallohydrolase 2
VEGERCVAVIDTGGSIVVGRAWREAVALHTAKPVCYVINTHVHPDHVLGNAAFKGAGPGGQDPQFVGHERLAASLAARGPYYRNALKRDFEAEHAASEIVPPTLPVAGTQQLDLGGRVLMLRAWPTAHTDGDLTVLDAATGTLWAGDLLFAGHLPVLDGKLKGWLAVLDELATWKQVKTVVPGHGEPSTQWPGALAAQRRYLTELRDGVRTAIRDGLTIAQAVDKLGALGTQGWLLTDAFHRRNLTAAYAELEWE